jgi:aspartate carbamoyltransferase catalytic subunit
MLNNSDVRKTAWLKRHIVSARQFSREDLDIVMERAAAMEMLANTKGSSKALDGKVMSTLFYEPSTRTRMSFEFAMSKLGGRVCATENAKEFSSAAKGETIEDTIRVLAYADVIVIRHYEQGAAARASMVSSVPIINAGDGPGEHPTQALLDLYTIKKEFGTVENKTIAMVGDLLNGRTVRSLSQLLTHFPGVRIIFISPKRLRICDDIKQLLNDKGVAFEESERLEDGLKADVLYMTRIQKERFKHPDGTADEEEYNKYKGVYVLGLDKIRQMPDHAIIMHPLPRVDEIPVEADNDHRARYFEQAKNGLYVRMALLDLLMNGRAE